MNGDESPESESSAAAEAREHYQEGTRLYAEGRYEEAIVEFEHAYAKRPHPNVLYNIGQAQERLLDYNQSVLWFERFCARRRPTPNCASPSRIACGCCGACRRVCRSRPSPKTPT